MTNIKKLFGLCLLLAIIGAGMTVGSAASSSVKTVTVDRFFQDDCEIKLMQIVNQQGIVVEEQVRFSLAKGKDIAKEMTDNPKRAHKIAGAAISRASEKQMLFLSAFEEERVVLNLESGINPPTNSVCLFMTAELMPQQSILIMRPMTMASDFSSTIQGTRTRGVRGVITEEKIYLDPIDGVDPSVMGQEYERYCRKNGMSAILKVYNASDVASIVATGAKDFEVSSKDNLPRKKICMPSSKYEIEWHPKEGVYFGVLRNPNSPESSDEQVVVGITNHWKAERNVKEISAMAVEYSKKNTNISPLSSDSRTYESRILAGVTDNAYADGKFLESLPYGGIYSAPTWDLLERTSIIPLGKTF